MSVDFKEYSRLRDIAVKRVKRLAESGVIAGYEFPTVKEVRGMSEQEQSRRFSALSGFLESGPSLSKKRERRTKASKEERAKNRREYQRDYRRRKVAQQYEKPGNPKKYQSYLKGLKTMGLNLKPSQLPSFFAYMDYRFSQGNFAKQYVFDQFATNYLELLAEGYKPAQILADYQQFESDQLGISAKADEMEGRSSEEVLKAWRKFIDNRRG